MKILFKYLCFFCSLLLLGTLGFSQVTINGPTCVIPGTVYQYTIKGNWHTASTMQVCLSNGVIDDFIDTSTCTSSGGAPLSTVLVIWNPGSTGSLILNSATGNTSITVNITTKLIPGSIDSTIMHQIVGIDSIPHTINCSPATGGSCNASYKYQWQQSPDLVSWADIKGATGQNLNFTTHIAQTTFFRRKITEKRSGSIAYSNAAIVDVLLIMPPINSSSIGSNINSSIIKGIEKMITSGKQDDYINTNSYQKNVFISSFGIVCREKIRPNFSEMKLAAFNTSTLLYA